MQYKYTMQLLIVYVKHFEEISLLLAVLGLFFSCIE
jgi:hypothetical protein